MALASAGAGYLMPSLARCSIEAAQYGKPAEDVIGFLLVVGCMAQPEHLERCAQTGNPTRSSQLNADM